LSHRDLQKDTANLAPLQFGCGVGSEDLSMQPRAGRAAQLKFTGITTYKNPGPLLSSPGLFGVLISNVSVS